MKQLLCLGICLALVGPATAQAESRKASLPADLAAVPNDAFAFAHVKLADLWNNDALKDVRAILQKAGPKAIEAFDKRFTPAPSTIERITVYLPPPDFEKGPQFDFVFILSVSQPFERDKLLKQLGKTTVHKGRNGEFHVDPDESIAVRFLDERTMAFGTVQAIQFSIDNPPPMKPGPLSPGLELAAGKRPIVIGMNASVLPPDVVDHLQREIPEPLHPLFKAQAIFASLDLDGDGHFYAQATYPDGPSAEAAEKAIAAATEMAKDLIAQTRKELTENVFGEGKDTKIEDLPFAAGSLLGLGALQHAEDLLDSKPVKRSGDSLRTTLALPPHFKSLFGTAAVAGSMFAPAVGKLKEGAVRAQSANNLKQIGLALHNYHDTMGNFPPAAIVDEQGNRLLSWRVAILPYIEQVELYKQFKLDEPWDSDHNKKLIAKMPKTYALPNKMSKPGETHYRVFVGNGALFDWDQGTKMAQVTDGLSNTWMAVEATEGVPWTKPDELEFDPAKDLPKLGKAFKGGFHVLYCDSSTRFVREGIDKTVMKAMITRNGGEVITDR